MTLKLADINSGAVRQAPNERAALRGAKFKVQCATLIEMKGRFKFSGCVQQFNGLPFNEARPGPHSKKLQVVPPLCSVVVVDQVRVLPAYRKRTETHSYRIFDSDARREEFRNPGRRFALGELAASLEAWV